MGFELIDADAAPHATAQRALSAVNYRTRVFAAPQDISAADWNGLLAQQQGATPFMRHEYLAALHASGCAQAEAGWQAQFLSLWRDGELHAACPLYLKNHSRGEYVFDGSWAHAYAQHGLDYFPKALVAVPFTPVPGARLLARDDAARAALVRALIEHAQSENLSSLHLLFASAPDLAACRSAGLLLRQTVQFHWTNHAPAPHPPGWADTADADRQPFDDFEHFLASLQQEKRKKIRQERRKVEQAGVRFRCLLGPEIKTADWDFFYHCYRRTYLEHSNQPYLNREFFQLQAQLMPQHWLLFVAERAGQAIACSLVGIDPNARVAYGRYWGALERVDCLHFEACYYQPLIWCIAHGYLRFEGGAQGEHKMARALLPVKTGSAHWLAQPAFAHAVERFLQREDQGLALYLEQLDQRTPLKTSPPAAAGAKQRAQPAA